MPGCMLVVPATQEAEAQELEASLDTKQGPLVGKQNRNIVCLTQLDCQQTYLSGPVISSTSAMSRSPFKSITTRQGSSVAPSADMSAQPYSTTD